MLDVARIVTIFFDQRRAENRFCKGDESICFADGKVGRDGKIAIREECSSLGRSQKATRRWLFEGLSIHANVGVGGVVGAVFDHLGVPKVAHHADLELLTDNRQFGGDVAHADLFFKVHGVAP